jgi:hypothetical protein
VHHDADLASAATAELPEQVPQEQGPTGAADAELDGVRPLSVDDGGELGRAVMSAQIGRLDSESLQRLSEGACRAVPGARESRHDHDRLAATSKRHGFNAIRGEAAGKGVLVVD